jgi:hypothetical protein
MFSQHQDISLEGICGSDQGALIVMSIAIENNLLPGRTLGSLMPEASPAPPDQIDDPGNLTLISLSLSRRFPERSPKACFDLPIAPPESFRRLH